MAAACIQRLKALAVSRASSVLSASGVKAAFGASRPLRKRCLRVSVSALSRLKASDRMFALPVRPWVRAFLLWPLVLLAHLVALPSAALCPLSARAWVRLLVAQPQVSRSFLAQIASGRSRKAVRFRANLPHLVRLFPRLCLKLSLTVLPLAWAVFLALVAKPSLVMCFLALLAALALGQQRMSPPKLFSKLWSERRPV